MGDGFEDKFERYLQSHIHPDVQPVARRAVNLGKVTMEGFLDLAENVFQASHDAFDSDAVTGEIDNVLPFDRSRVDL